MAKKRINVYWLLLLVLMYTASILLSVGQTQARFNDTVSATTLVGSQQAEVTSNCLVTAQDANVTVLGGQMSLITSTKLSFWLKSTGADAVGVLRWGVRNPDHAQYLKITMQSGADVISPESEIDLLEDVPMELTMTLTPTETARNTVHEEMKIYVLVTWGDRMWGTFQVILPEVKEETEPEETEPEETEPEETQPEETQPEETKSEGTDTDGTDTEGTDTDGTDTDGTETEGTDTDGTDIEGTDTDGTDTEGTDTEGTDTEGTETEGTETEGTDTDGTDTEGTETEGTDNEGTDTDGTGTEGADTDGTGTEGTDTEGTETDGTDTEGTETEGTETEGTDTEGTDTEGTDTEGTGTEGMETEGTDTEGTDTEGTDTEGTDTEGTDTEGTDTEGTDTEGTDTEGTDTEGTDTEGTDTDGTETDGTEGTEPGETESGETEPVETEPEDTQPEETEPEDTESEEDPVRLETLSRFDAAGMLPVNVVLTEDVTSVRIGLGQINSETEEDPEQLAADVLPLPNKTRFSLDGGKNFYMLYEGSVAEFTVKEMTSFTMLLDLRYTGMEVGTGFLLAMDAYAGEEPVANSFARTICGTTKPVKAAVYDKEAYQKRQMRTTAEEEEEPLKKKGSYVLNQNTVLELTMPEEWREAEMVYSLEFLALTEEKTLEYKPVNLKNSGLYVVYDGEEPEDTEKKEEKQEEDTREHTLVLGIGDVLPQAGTYRIRMEWTYEGVCYAKKQMTFFINYAAAQVFAE